MKYLQGTAYVAVIVYVLAYFIGTAFQYSADKRCLEHGMPKAKIVWFQDIYCVGGGQSFTSSQSDMKGNATAETYYVPKAFPLRMFPEAE